MHLSEQHARVRAITLATANAVAVRKSCKQDDFIVAANMGREAISDMVSTCKAAAYASEAQELKTQAIQLGHNVAIQYRELLQIVMHILNKATMKQKPICQPFLARLHSV